MLRNVFNLSLLAAPKAFASGVTRITDLIVPDVFSPYVQNLTQEKSRLVQSGAVVADPKLAEVLAGGGLTFNEPSFKDLDNDSENTSSDDPTVESTPNKIGTLQEIQVRMSRNNSWRYCRMHLSKLFQGHLLDLVQRIRLDPGRAKEGSLETKQPFEREIVCSQCGDTLEWKISLGALDDGSI